MGEASVLYIETILTHNGFGGKLRNFFDRYFKDIDEAVKRIPRFLKEVSRICIRIYMIYFKGASIHVSIHNIVSILPFYAD